nr:MAG TPA: acyl carrier protein [Caudoviricetes sp.]
MNANEVKKHVLEVISAKSWLAASDIKDEYKLESDLGMDSLDRVELIMALEREFDVSISDDELTAIEQMSVAELSDFMVQKTGK